MRIDGLGELGENAMVLFCLRTGLTETAENSTGRLKRLTCAAHLFVRSEKGKS